MNKNLYKQSNIPSIDKGKYGYTGIKMPYAATSWLPAERQPSEAGYAGRSSERLLTAVHLHLRTLLVP